MVRQAKTRNIVDSIVGSSVVKITGFDEARMSITIESAQNISMMVFCCCMKD